MNYCMEFWKSLYRNSAVFRVNTSPTVSYKTSTVIFEKKGIRSSLFYLESSWKSSARKHKKTHLSGIHSSFFSPKRTTDFFLFGWFAFFICFHKMSTYLNVLLTNKYRVYYFSILLYYTIEKIKKSIFWSEFPLYQRTIFVKSLYSAFVLTLLQKFHYVSRLSKVFKKVSFYNVCSATSTISLYRKTWSLFSSCNIR